VEEPLKTTFQVLICSLSVLYFIFFFSDLILCWLLSLRLSFGWFLFARPLFARILPDLGGAELTRFSFFFSFPGRGSVFFAVKSVTSANCAELSEFLLPRPELNLFLANLRSLILTFQLNFRHALISLSVSSHNGCSDISYYSIPQFGLISGPSFFCQLLHFLK
jgi:hypothetical protein